MGESLQGVYLSSRVGSEPLSWQAGSQDEGVTGDSPGGDYDRRGEY